MKYYISYNHSIHYSLHLYTYCMKLVPYVNCHIRIPTKALFTRIIGTTYCASIYIYFKVIGSNVVYTFGTYII